MTKSDEDDEGGMTRGKTTMSKQHGWHVENMGDDSIGDDLWIIPRDIDPDKNHAVTVYLRESDIEVQIDRLVELLNDIAPDGVLPAVADEIAP